MYITIYNKNAAIQTRFYAGIYESRCEIVCLCVDILLSIFDNVIL